MYILMSPTPPNTICSKGFLYTPSPITCYLIKHGSRMNLPELAIMLGLVVRQFSSDNPGRVSNNSGLGQGRGGGMVLEKAVSHLYFL